jgi:hypothetical protein
VPPWEARIAFIAERLGALGLVAQVRESPDRVTVSARVPRDFPVGSWLFVLQLLETADAFGLDDSAVRGRSIWAAVRRHGPGITTPTESRPDQP